jgi:uncharacterized lipoprotein YddW (UPF0748 family)
MKYLFYSFLFLNFSLGLFAQVPKEEVRAVWLTSNYSLDWPSKPYKNSNDINFQQDELIDILDQLKAANFNVVFLQTRLRGDVIYNSNIEPVSPYIRTVVNTWSKYDPLAFAIAECRKRGLECHAWFVTYPVGPEKINGKENNSSTIRKHKDKISRFKGEFYLDPGNPNTNSYLLSLIEEIVNKYDIDGIHLDYIRYPDKSENFPDNATYRRYGDGKNLSDWRRENINNFVYQVYDVVKSKKPWVQVSSSVAGMYNAIGNNTQKHWTAFHSVYQDPEDWLKKGKHDFIVPMMYFSDDLFFPFLKDWKARSNERYVVPGLGVYQMDERESNWRPQTIKEQVQSTRDHQMKGNAFYRTQHLVNNKKGIMTLLSQNFYQNPAVLPPLTWLNDVAPIPPINIKAMATGIYMFLSWEETQQPENKPVFYNVYRSKTLPIDTGDANNLWAARVSEQMVFVPIDKSVETGYYYAVTSYDRYRNESPVSDPVYYVTGNFEK